MMLVDYQYMFIYYDLIIQKLFNYYYKVCLLNWKIEIDTIIQNLNDPYERDFITREKLDVIANILKNELKERAIILELIIWKISCIRSCCNNVHESNIVSSMSTTTVSMNDLLEKFVVINGGGGDPKQFKQNCRITSGAEMIIPGILPFLDDGPINKILLELETGFK